MSLGSGHWLGTACCRFRSTQYDTIQKQLLLNEEIVKGVFMDTSGFDTIHVILWRPPPPRQTWVAATSPSTKLSHGVGCSMERLLDALLAKMTMYQGMRECGPRMDVAASLYAQVHDVACESNVDGSYHPENATCSCARNLPKFGRAPSAMGLLPCSS